MEWMNGSKKRQSDRNPPSAELALGLPPPLGGPQAFPLYRLAAAGAELAECATRGQLAPGQVPAAAGRGGAPHAGSRQPLLPPPRTGCAGP